MKIFITGGAGCLGSNIINFLLNKRKYSILSIDNYETSTSDNLPKNSNLKIVEDSISNYKVVNSIFEDFKPNILIHCAVSYKDPLAYFKDIEVNVNSTINLIENCKKYKIDKFINFQTSLCYGNPYVLPIPEEHYLNPRSSYGISKAAGELYLANSDINYISLRLASVLAPNMTVGAIPTFFKRLSEGKECFCSKAKRDFIGINDFLTLIDLIINNNIPKGIYNISSGIGVSMKEIHDQIAEILGIQLNKNVKIVDVGADDVETIVLDPSKAKNVFNWSTKSSFNDDLKELINSYKKSGLNQIYSHVKKQILEDD